MRERVILPVHRTYAADVGPALSRRVLAADLRQIGRHHLDAGRSTEARAAYRASLRHRPSPKALLAVAALTLPGSERLRASEQRLRAKRRVA
jgi:hypothetical protein